jgi:hypothetical protein
MISIVIALALFGSGFLYAKITADLPSVEVLPVLLNASDGELLTPAACSIVQAGCPLYISRPRIERKYLYVDPEETNHISRKCCEPSPQRWNLISGNLRAMI